MQKGFSGGVLRGTGADASVSGWMGGMRDIGELFDVAEDACFLRVHVQPGAGRDAVSGVHGDALKVRLRARAKGGEANAALQRFLSEALLFSRSGVDLVSGQKSRIKRVRVELSGPLLADRLTALLEDSSG